MAAVIINFLVGAVIVIAMVDVPLFVNVVEGEVARSAVISGWVLSALTAAMAVAAYIGGRLAERFSYRLPIVAGLIAALTGFTLMGTGWTADISYTAMAWQLALLGAGFGLIIAPTAAAVVDAATADRRGWPWPVNISTWPNRAATACCASRCAIPSDARSTCWVSRTATT